MMSVFLSIYTVLVICFVNLMYVAHKGCTDSLLSSHLKISLYTENLRWVYSYSSLYKFREPGRSEFNHVYIVLSPNQQ